MGHSAALRDAARDRGSCRPVSRIRDCARWPASRGCDAGSRSCGCSRRPTEPLTATTLAARLDLPRSSTYHLLTELEAAGVVAHLPDRGRWAVGIGAFEIGTGYLRHHPVDEVAGPSLRRLARRVGHDVHLGVLDGRELLYLLRERPPRPQTLVTAVGVRLPAHLTASGRAVLAGLDPAQRRAVLAGGGPLTRRTDRGPTSQRTLTAVLAADARRGWSVEDGEVSRGYASVAHADPGRRRAGGRRDQRDVPAPVRAGVRRHLRPARDGRRAHRRRDHPASRRRVGRTSLTDVRAAAPAPACHGEPTFVVRDPVPGRPPLPPVASLSSTTPESGWSTCRAVLRTPRHAASRTGTRPAGPGWRRSTRWPSRTTGRWWRRATGPPTCAGAPSTAGCASSTWRVAAGSSPPS